MDGILDLLSPTYPPSIPEYRVGMHQSRSSLPDVVCSRPTNVKLPLLFPLRITMSSLDQLPMNLP